MAQGTEINRAADDFQLPDRCVFGHYVIALNRSFAKYIMSNDSVNIDRYSLMNR